MTRARPSACTIAAISPLGIAPLLGTRATTPMSPPASLWSTRRPSPTDAAATAAREASDESAKVNTVPGSTTVGTVSNGRVIWRVSRSVMCERVTIKKLSHYRSALLRGLLGVTYGILPRGLLSQQFPVRHDHPGQADAQHAPQPTAVAIQRGELAVDLAGDDTDLVVAVGTPDELDATVELIAPEERHRRVGDRMDTVELRQQVGGRGRALLGGVGPVLDPHLLAGVAEEVVDPPRTIARRVHTWRGAQTVAADDPVTQFETTAGQPVRRRRDADAHDHDAGGDDLAVGQQHSGGSV